MSIGDISLTAGMRNNLVALQHTAQLVQTTQGHLSTGKKVNSALDNPVEFFASQNMLNAANDLAGYKDGMSNGIQMIQAANQGITGITSLIAQAKSIAQSAIGSGIGGAGTANATLYAQYTGILAQIDKMAGDAGFQGVNLLSVNGSYTVTFGNGTGDSLGLTGFDATYNGGGVNGHAGLAISTTGSNTGWSGTTSADVDTSVNTDIASLDGATATLRNQSKALSSNLSLITARQDFTANMINVLQTGSDNLTLADTNEEGANMLMLQTRQSLGTTSLSLASQAAQSVLKLFG